MKFALFLVGVAAVSVLAQDTRIEEVDKSPVETKFLPGGHLKMNLCSSGVEVKGVDEGVLRVSYFSEHDRTGDLRVKIETAGDQGKIRVTGCPHNNFRLRIEVPKSSDLYVRMFAGELDIRNITGNKDVQLSAGELRVDVGEPADYARVHASVSTGDLEAPLFHVSKGGLFRSFEQNGPGKYDLHAHVGAGQIEFR